jgi:hypothetical protein
LRRPRTDRAWAVLLFVLALLVYNANLRVIALGDSRATRFMPFALLRGSLTLDDFREQVVGFFSGTIYWAEEIGGHLVPRYPIVTPLLVAPLYAPATLYLEKTGWEQRSLAFTAALMEKIAASTVAALSAALLYLLLRRRAPRGDAVLLTMAYAFGTNTWATSSQALWQHGPAQLLLVGALLAVTGDWTPRRLAVAGLLCGLLIANRPPDVLLAGSLALYLAASLPDKRLLVWFAAPIALVGGLAFAYNLHYFGHPMGHYPLMTVMGRFFSYPPLWGTLGLLLSPAKGLLVFSPFLFFLVARPFVTGAPADRLLTLCLTLGVVAQILLYARTDWRAGYCYGPRFLIDLLPILIWMLVPVLARMGLALRLVFAAGVLAAMAIQVIGVLYYPTGQSDKVVTRDFVSAWIPGNAQFLLEYRHGHLPWE